MLRLHCADPQRALRGAVGAPTPLRALTYAVEQPGDVGHKALGDVALGRQVRFATSHRGQGLVPLLAQLLDN
ncbi:hypothetical protein [Streptomyces atratus]